MIISKFKQGNTIKAEYTKPLIEVVSVCVESSLLELSGIDISNDDVNVDDEGL